MKKPVFLLITAILLNTTVLAEKDISVYLNNKKMTFSQAPVIRNDSTLVPFRAIFEELNMTVQWFEEHRRVTAEKEGLLVTLNIDSYEMLVNNEAVKLNTPPIIYNDYTLVPLRAVSEAAGAQVEWDGGTRTVYITAEESNFEDWSNQVLELINEEREKNGLCQLKMDPSLTGLAREHCEDMIERDYVSHNNLDGETPFDRMMAAGISYKYAGENIAAGAASPALAVKAWMESDEHRSNLLNPNFEHTGISVIRGGKYGIYWVQEFATYKQEK